MKEGSDGSYLFEQMLGLPKSVKARGYHRALNLG
jgi:hypothetical protein